MLTKQFGTTIAVRLDRGEEICESLREVCETFGVTAGMIQGLGAAKNATVGLFDLEEKQYHETALTGFFEITNLTGNVSVMDGDCYLHLHITLADESGSAFGGHLKKAVVGAVAEIFITPLSGTIERAADDATGLNLMTW